MEKPLRFLKFEDTFFILPVRERNQRINLI